MAYGREVKQQAVDLRVDQRKSLDAIHEITGVAKSSLSLWLRGFPLTQEEISARMSANGGSEPKDRGTVSKHYLTVTGKLSRQQKATIAELAVLFRIHLNGFRSFKPTADGEKSDIMVEVPETGKVWRVQVKWVRQLRHGVPVITLHCQDGHHGFRRYVKGEFDFIIGYYLYSDTSYIYSFEELEKHKTTVSISPEHAERWDKLRE